MKLKDKELWLELYEVAKKIQEIEPWNYLWDTDLLVYKCIPMNKIFYCSVMGHGGTIKSIAMYEGEQIYGFFELAEGEYPKYELINYQECLTCNFLKRQETLPKNIELIKELGLKFRGTWISFENFEKGYEPSPMNINQVKIMIEALKNFYMMFEAIIVHGLQTDFENNEVLVRHYDKNQDIYLNYNAPLELPEKHFFMVKAKPEFEEEIRGLSRTNIELEYDFLNYLPIRIKNYVEEDGRRYYPIVRFITERKTGLIMSYDFINKNNYNSKQEYILESIEELLTIFYKIGIPKSIYVRDEEARIYLKDICDKAKIKIIVRSKLRAIDNCYRELLNTDII